MKSLEETDEHTKDQQKEQKCGANYASFFLFLNF